MCLENGRYDATLTLVRHRALTLGTLGLRQPPFISSTRPPACHIAFTRVPCRTQVPRGAVPDSPLCAFCAVEVGGRACVPVDLPPRHAGTGQRRTRRLGQTPPTS